MLAVRPILLLALLLAAGWLAAGARTPAVPAGRPCAFVDADGDGLNDIARDRDGDGLPDGLEARCDTLGLRWAAFRAVPDSAAVDSLAFAAWWRLAGDGRTDGPRAWANWRAWTRPTANCACGCLRCRCLH